MEGKPRQSRKRWQSLKGGNNGKRNENSSTGLESGKRQSYCSRTPRLEQGEAGRFAGEWRVCYKQGQHNQGKEVVRS